MLFATAGQLSVFLWMIGTGLLIGAFCFLCAGLRRLLSAGFWLTLLIDTAFGAGAGLILSVSLLRSVYGALRLYELAGVALGAALFTFGPAPLLRTGARLLGCRARHIFAAIRKIRPIKVIFK